MLTRSCQCVVVYILRPRNKCGRQTHELMILCNNVYGAVVVTIAIHPVDLLNADTAPTLRTIPPTLSVHPAA